MDEYYTPPIIGNVEFSNLLPENKIKNFDFINRVDCQYIFARYLCGGIALREGKKISLKKINAYKTGASY
jgi:hypothetical protein